MSGDIIGRFQAALASAEADLGRSVTDLPHRLARAGRTCCHADAAALSVHSGERRVAIGVSDDLAAQAERLQFTVGSGPALDAAGTGRLVAADEEAIRQRWSVFAADLFAHTPIRSIISLPLLAHGDTRVTLDLYFSEGTTSHLSTLDLALVGDAISDLLIDAMNASDASEWLDTAESYRRDQVWIAVGRIIEALTVLPQDALALLRAHANTLGMDIDALATQIADGTVSTEQLNPADANP